MSKKTNQKPKRICLDEILDDLMFTLEQNKKLKLYEHKKKKRRKK